MLEHEWQIRLAAFAGTLTLVAVWEVIWPRRQLLIGKARRWLNNLALVALNTLVVRILFPFGAAGAAHLAGERGWGMLNQFEIPWMLAVAIGVVALDFVIYLQHVMFHSLPLLWRLHRMHHADLDIDTTTGLRFHPVEIVLSMLIKIAAVALLGPPVLAVIIFEIVLNAGAMFNHGNIRIPLAIDRVLRWLIVTPDMHRVHHSIHAHESNSNFGFNLPWWDRLCGTYRAQPADGHEAMRIGITTFQSEQTCQGLIGMLKIPFLRGEAEDRYPINRRPWDSQIGDNKKKRKL